MNVHVGGAVGGAVAPKFKVGDRVRVKDDDQNRDVRGALGTVAEDDGETFRPLRILLDNESKIWRQHEDLEPTILRIEAGKFYKTRDGCKVGPMVACGSKEWPWELKDSWQRIDGTRAAWRADGTFSVKKKETHAVDLIAEWPADTKGCAAAEIDNLRAEYGSPGAPKFKVGDRVVSRDYNRRGEDCFGTVARVNDGYVYAVDWTVGMKSGRLSFDQLELVATTPAIVCLIENSQPKPATNPHVHPDRATAEKEAKRLALVNKGQEFGVYEFTSSVKEERTYEHEWQRLAAMGLDESAASELSALSGLSWDAAHIAVLTRAA